MHLDCPSDPPSAAIQLFQLLSALSPLIRREVSVAFVLRSPNTLRGASLPWQDTGLLRPATLMIDPSGAQRIEVRRSVKRAPSPEALLLARLLVSATTQGNEASPDLRAVFERLAENGFEGLLACPPHRG